MDDVPYLPVAAINAAVACSVGVKGVGRGCDRDDMVIVIDLACVL